MGYPNRHTRCKFPKNILLFMFSKWKKTSRYQRSENPKFRLHVAHRNRASATKNRLSEWFLTSELNKMPIPLFIVLYSCWMSYEWILSNFASISSVCLLHTRSHTQLYIWLLWIIVNPNIYLFYLCVADTYRHNNGSELCCL